mgnify:CR=1 FL=1
MPDIIDYWEDGEFEESVSAALIACFESKIKKKKAKQVAAAYSFKRKGK